MAPPSFPGYLSFDKGHGAGAQETGARICHFSGGVIQNLGGGGENWKMKKKKPK